MIKIELAILHEKMGNLEKAKEVMKAGLLMAKRLNFQIAKMGSKHKIQEFIERYPDIFPAEEFPCK